MAAALVLPAAASAAVSETDCNGSAAAGADQPGTFDQFWVRRGPGWTGGDQALSVRLGDGRTAWLYADTILGTVNADDTRGPGAPIVHNTVAIQNGACVTTWHGGTQASPAPLVAPADPSSWYWPGAAVVDGGNLKVVLNEFNGTDQGLTGYTHVADFVATISLADMSVQSVQQINSPASLFWGSAILSDGGYTYIYGADQDGAGTKHAHVARVADGSLDQTSQWTFWNGITWVSDPTASARIADGVSMLYSVIKTGVGYTLVSQDGFFSREIYEWQGATPAGPFPTKWDLGALPDPGSNRSAYNAILHPEFDSGGEVLLGYSVGANDLNYTDASSYRPQFASIQAPTWGVPSNLLNLMKASSTGPRVAQPPPAVTPPPPPPPPAPGVLRVRSGRLSVGQGGAVRVPVTCAGGVAACRGALLLETAAARRRSATAAKGVKRIATRALRVGAGQASFVTLRLGGATLKRLRATHRLPAQARVTGPNAIATTAPARELLVLGRGR